MSELILKFFLHFACSFFLIFLLEIALATLAKRVDHSVNVRTVGGELDSAEVVVA